MSNEMDMFLANEHHRNHRRWRLAIAIVGATALLARLGAIWSIWSSFPRQYLLNADAGYYHATSLIVGGLEDGRLPDVFGLSPFTTYFGGALHFLLGPSPVAVLIPQAFLGAFTAMMAAHLARRLADPTAGLAAGFLVALCQPLIIYDSAILPTCFAVFLTTALMWAAMRFNDRRSWSRCVVAGLVLGVGITCRANLGLLAPFFLFLILWGSKDEPVRRRLLLATAFTIATLLPIAPVTARNAMVGHVFVPVTHAAGINLFIGNNQGATGRLKPVFGANNAVASFEIFHQKAQQHEGHQMDPAQVSSFWARQTLAEIADNPLRWAVLLGKKLVYGLNNFEVPDSVDPQFLAQGAGFSAVPLPGFAILFALGLPGLFLIDRSRKKDTAILAAVGLAALFTMLIFFVQGRYRATALVPLAIAAGVTVSWMVARWRAHRLRQQGPDARKLLVACLVVLLLCALSNLPVLQGNPEFEQARLNLFLQR